VADIDILNQGGSIWTSHLAAANVPTAMHQSLGIQRANVWASLAANGKDPKIDGGLALLSGSELEAAENLLKQLAEYGLFVVPAGEVEHWLATTGVSRNKHGWLRSIFSAMRDNPADPNYVQPAAEDVWDFMGIVKAWMANPMRRGIP